MTHKLLLLNHPNLVLTRLGTGTNPEAMQRNNNHVTGVSTPPGCKGQDDPANVKVVVHRSLMLEVNESCWLWVDFLAIMHRRSNVICSVEPYMTILKRSRDF